MIRKGTLITLVVFILLMGLAFYLNQNPLPKAAVLTPSPTAASQALAGWQSADIVSVDVKGDAGAETITQAADGSWKLSGSSDPVSAAQVESLRSQLAAMQVVTSLDASVSPESVGLTSPTSIITLRNKAGEQRVLRIGKPVPTGSGYYVQVDTHPAVVISQEAINAVLQLLKPGALLAIPPTPDQALTPVIPATPTP